MPPTYFGSLLGKVRTKIILDHENIPRFNLSRSRHYRLHYRITCFYLLLLHFKTMTTLSPELPNRIISKKTTFIWNLVKDDRQLSHLQNNKHIQLENIELDYEGRFKRSIQVVFFNN